MIQLYLIWKKLQSHVVAQAVIQVHSELSSFIRMLSIHCWCDFMIGLHLFNGDGKKQEVFVRKRVEEVHKLVDVDWWYHVESKLNPTDILSRGLRFSEVIDDDYGLKDYQQFY